MNKREHDNQVYTCIGSEPYTRRDGTETRLLIWQSPAIPAASCSSSRHRQLR